MCLSVLDRSLVSGCESLVLLDLPHSRPPSRDPKESSSKALDCFRSRADPPGST